MRTRFYFLAHLAVIPFLLASACFADPSYTCPEEATEADEDFAYQGEYVGTLNDDGEEITLAMQIIAQGNNEFLCKFYTGGLPGTEGSRQRRTSQLTREGDKFSTESNPGGLDIVEGVLRAYDPEGNEEFALEKVHRESPTLGAAPPEGAVVLFDGTGVDAWQEGAEMTEDGLLMQGVTSNETFGSHQLHVEFLLPYMPADRGQGRGNSGCYLQGRYETQILDSFGLEGLNNECGGVYELKDPDVNMCFPPLAWQTYDIEFHAAQFDDQGNETAPAHMTVQHNGVVIHDDIELPTPTRAAPVAAGPEPGPVYLQDHGNPVRFQNIWVLPLEDE